MNDVSVHAYQQERSCDHIGLVNQRRDHEFVIIAPVKDRVAHVKPLYIAR